MTGPFQVPEESPLEPFAYADAYLRASIFSDLPVIDDNASCIQYMYDDGFKPALILQLAGLQHIRGQRRGWNGPFAFAVVDHLIMGWNCVLLSHMRVACSLIRMITEAIIFEIAATVAEPEFYSLWKQQRATGGGILKLLSGKVPPILEHQLRSAWASTREFGHAGYTPTALTTPLIDRDGNTLGLLTFGGPSLGVLPRPVALRLGAMFTILSEIAALAFGYAFADGLEEFKEWQALYREHMEKLEKRLQEFLAVKPVET
jgi:hypothetical protein